MSYRHSTVTVSSLVVDPSHAPVEDDQSPILAPAGDGQDPSTASGGPRVVVVDGPPRGTPCLSTNSSLTPRIVHAEPVTLFPELIASIPWSPKIFPEWLVP